MFYPKANKRRENWERNAIRGGLVIGGGVALNQLG